MREIPFFHIFSKFEPPYWSRHIEFLENSNAVF